MKKLLFLVILGLAVDAQYWRRDQNQQEARNIKKLEYARDLYFMDEVGQRVQSLPSNSRNIVSPTVARILLQLQLTYYRDPNRALPNNRVCYYNPPNSNSQPSGNNNTNSGNSGPATQNCRFMFTTLVTSPDNTMSVYTAGPIKLAQDGSANLNMYAPWTQPQTLGFNIKPMSIEVLVHHYGNVADQNGNLITYGALVHVDSFTLSLLTVTPAAPGVNYNSQNQGLIGISSLRTSLTINYGMRCNINGQLGPNCDLICNSGSGIQSGLLVCNSTLTQKTYVCRANNTFGSNPGQVSNCTYCQFGASGSGCLNASPSFRSNISKGVAHGYYVATIVLAVIAGILLIILIAAVLLWLWGNKEEDNTNRRDWSFGARNRPDIVRTSKPSPPLGQGYRPVNTQPDPEWQAAPRTQAGMQRSSVTDSQTNSTARAPGAYYDQPGDRPVPPLATAEATGSRASEASSNASYPSATRREAAV